MMKQNQQHNNQVSKELQKFRSQIDDIDQKIIDLLGERMEVVSQVGLYKTKMKDKCFIRSNREADMIKNLVINANDSIPKSIIVAIWRKIITSANVLEQEIKIGVHNPRKLPTYYHQITEYYTDFVPIADYSSSTNVMLEIEKDNIQLGVFALEKNDCDANFSNTKLDHWWINMANSRTGLKVFARIPFVEYKKDQNLLKDDLFVVAIKDAEESKSDRSLIVVELESTHSVHSLQKALKEKDIDAKILKNVQIREIRGITFYLLDVKGFYLEDDEKLQNLAKDKIKPHVKVIGNYATSIKL